MDKEKQLEINQWIENITINYDFTDDRDIATLKGIMKHFHSLEVSAEIGFDIIKRQAIEIKKLKKRAEGAEQKIAEVIDRHVCTQ